MLFFGWDSGIIFEFAFDYAIKRNNNDDENDGVEGSVRVLVLMAGSRRKGGNKAKVKNLSLGDLVLAKVKGFPPWPAKVSSFFFNLLFYYYCYYYFFLSSILGLFLYSDYYIFNFLFLNL